MGGVKLGSAEGGDGGLPHGRLRRSRLQFPPFRHKVACFSGYNGSVTGINQGCTQLHLHLLLLGHVRRADIKSNSLHTAPILHQPINLLLIKSNRLDSVIEAERDLSGSQALQSGNDRPGGANNTHGKSSTEPEYASYSPVKLSVPFMHQNHRRSLGFLSALIHCHFVPSLSHLWRTAPVDVQRKQNLAQSNQC